MAKRVKVIQESATGRNKQFHDNYLGINMTRAEFVRAIQAGEYPHYHVRRIQGIKTPASNPDLIDLNHNLSG